MALIIGMTSFPVQSQALDNTALPSGGAIVAGEASFDYGTANELHVQQSTDRTVINWDSFNIGQDSLTEFHQPSSSALAVNRITGASIDPTQILGSLKANGQILVLDGNGVIFGENSIIDVGSLIATTGKVDTQKIMNGSAIEITDIGDTGFVINQGSINIKDAGLAAFVAPMVINNGVINAHLGRVQIGAASVATLDLYGDGLMELALDEGRTQTLVNNGLISANGGFVQIHAAAARDVVDNLVMNTGVITATTISQDETGKIILSAGGANKSDAQGISATIQAGVLDVSGYDAGETGGAVEVLGDLVVLESGSIIDASGYAGGGDIKIGGDYLGGGDTQTAMFTYVDDNAYLFNDAVIDGDGGRTIIWSDDTTEFRGNIYGRGGALSGNGGFTETSGKLNLLAQGYVDLTAENGDKGTYLLDPADITIYGNVDASFVSTDSTIDLNENLLVWLDANDATTVLDADGDNAETGTGGNNDGFSGVVSTWIDKSGNGNDVVGSATPTYTLNGLGEGMNSITLDGSDYFEKAGLNIDPNGEGFSFFGAFNYASGDGALVNWGRIDYNSLLLDHLEIHGTLFGKGTTPWVGLKDNQSFFGLSGADNENSLAYIYYDGAKQTYLEANGVKVYSSGTANNTTNTFRIGARRDVEDQYANGEYGEVLVYDKGLETEESNILEQYQAAKWGIALTAPGTGANEAEQAMAADGYGAFTTRYLERLSETADIVLQASDSITLDLQGDTLSLADDRNISLETTNGDITDLSSGTIQTNMLTDGGNISITAGGTGDINLGTTIFDTQNGGVVNLSAGGDVNVETTASLNLGNVTGTNVLIKANGTTSDVTLNDTVTSTAAGNSLIVAAGQDFFNNYGADALDAGAGRFLVYSSSPLTGSRGAQSFDFKRYDTNYDSYTPANVTESGDGFLYSIAPVITVTADDSTRDFNVSDPTFTATYSGFIDGDTIDSINGVTNFTTSASLKSAGGAYSITPSGSLGYGYTGTYVEGVLTVNNEVITDIIPDSVKIGITQKPKPVTVSALGSTSSSNTVLNVVEASASDDNGADQGDTPTDSTTKSCLDSVMGADCVFH
tara:strand:- start:105391 stop:108630 length:3240 start_codon:yes stop_codon:yes gene_type:complete